MEKKNGNKVVLMKQIKYIKDEMEKGSTGCFIDIHENIFYLLNGKLHKNDGPCSILSSGSKFWCFQGMDHRSDGPSIEYRDGSKEWWYYGINAKNEKEFYNMGWRKKIEIKRFL